MCLTASPRDFAGRLVVISLIPTLMLKILRLLKLICDLAQLHLDRAWSSGLRGGLTFPSGVGAHG